MLRTLFRSSVLIPLLLSITAQAQRPPKVSSIPSQVHGQVRYAQGGQPAEFVLVRLERYGAGIVEETTTDRSGKFNFTNLTAELYTLVVHAAGFREAQQQVDLRTQMTDYIQLQLVRDENATDDAGTKRGGVINANVPIKATEEFQKGHDALQRGQTAEGIVHLESALMIDPKYLEAMLLLGTAYMDNKEWDKAESKLRQLLDLNPKATAAHLVLGDLYVRQKKYAQAENDLLAAVSLDDRSVLGHFLLGCLYYQLGNIVKAGPQVGTALRLDPSFAEGHLLAGNILLRARQPENARIEFEEYLRLDPSGQFSRQAREAVQRIKQALASR